MTRLIRSELLKLRTTHTWWIFALASIVMTALAFWINAEQAHQQLNPDIGPAPQGADVTDQQRADYEDYRQQELARAAEAKTVAGLAKIAANVYTSGQFFGLLFVMLLAILLITNEFYHQTATATFLTTPKRTKVIAGKLITGTLIGLGFWVFTTLLVVAVGALYFNAEGVANSLGQWEVQRALLLNLLAYALWAIFGIGVGVLIRSQIGATITAAVLYTVGTFAALAVLQILYNTVLKKDWVLQSAVLIPPLASQHMISGLDFGDEIHAWPRWVGAIVLIAWAGVAGTIGTMITRRRDIS
jgi:ABC-type transport system involved in multi-copper enzyme maturation permease subunit